MHPPRATVTTVIPVFNGEAFFESTLRSLAEQNRRPDRVVILDNCSTDGTRRIVDQFTPIRCEWRQNERNIGHTGNLNRALEFAKETEYLHILLADDRIKPEFFEKILPALEPVNGRAIGYSPFELIDEYGTRLPPFVRATGSRPKEIPLRQFLATQAQLSTILIPAVVLKTGYQPSPFQLPLDMPQLGDTLFYARWGTIAEKIIEIPEPLCQYRIHSAQTTTKNMKNLQAWVLDEWRVMEAIAEQIREGRLAAWTRRQKLRCLFAARSHVKIAQMRKTSPDYADQIRTVARPVVSLPHWTAAKIIVSARNLCYRLIGRKPRLIG